MNSRFRVGVQCVNASSVLLATFILLLFTPQAVLAQTPQVHKVDPPSWWVRHSHNPIRLLIHGKNLQGAKVQAVETGLRLGIPKINSKGTYVFVDAFIAPQTRPASDS